MSRRDVGETWMGCVNICCYCSFQEWPQRRTIIRERLHTSPAPSTAAAAVMMVMVVVFPSFCSAASTRSVGAWDAWGSHGTASQDVRQNGCTLHVFHQKWDHVGELCLAQGVAQSTGPVDIIDCGMSVLQHNTASSEYTRISHTKAQIKLVRVLENVSGTNSCHAYHHRVIRFYYPVV
jgi:hypothetical protein